MSSLQVCRDGLNRATDGGAKFDCMSMAHPQGWTESPQAEHDDAEVKEQGKDGKTS